MKKLFLKCITLFVLLSIGCSEEETTLDVNPKNRLSTLQLIQEDVKSRKSYPNVINDYDYSSDYWNTYANNNNLYSNLSSKDYIAELESLNQHYLNLGYNQVDLNNYLEFVENSRKNSVLETINYLRDNGYIAVGDEYDILVYYIELFLSDEYAADEFDEITSVFVYHVNNTSLSDLQKRTLLTTFDMASNLKNEIENNELIVLSKMPDQEIVCAGDIIVGIVAGGILGNGPGAAIGLFTGLWAAYTDGCMD